MSTLTDVMTPHGVAVPEHLEAQADVRLLTGLQRQGDLFIVPMKPGKVAGLEPVPPEGIPVVRGEAGGNTHLLIADGPVFYARRDGQDLGTCVVEEGGAAYLIHPEHGASGMAPGTYGLRRQREQSDAVRLIAD